MRYTLEQVKGYLKDKITYSWYVNAKIDYNIDGRFIDCGIDENRLVICWEEDGKNIKPQLDIMMITHWSNSTIFGKKQNGKRSRHKNEGALPPKVKEVEK